MPQHSTSSSHSSDLKKLTATSHDQMLSAPHAPRKPKSHTDSTTSHSGLACTRTTQVHTAISWSLRRLIVVV